MTRLRLLALPNPSRLNALPLLVAAMSIRIGAISRWRAGRSGLGKKPGTPFYNPFMRAHVYVTLKTTVLDAQGQTIANALRRLHHPQVESVRQGKYFVLTLADSLTGDAARAEVERIAADVLTNPVIEDFTYKLDE